MNMYIFIYIIKQKKKRKFLHMQLFDGKHFQTLFICESNVPLFISRKLLIPQIYCKLFLRLSLIATTQCLFRRVFY